LSDVGEVKLNDAARLAFQGCRDGAQFLHVGLPLFDDRARLIFATNRR
jgi:hypothetical protein